MFGFRPATTSSPTKSLVTTSYSVAAPAAASDASRTSAASKTELQTLSLAEVEFLDAVIRRIPKNATSFLAGLKAYNDELHERGLDSQAETVHYGRLLELCKLKGPSWQVKWQGIKELYGYGTSSSTSEPPSQARVLAQTPFRSPPLSKPTRTLIRFTTPVRDSDDDVFTLHSHQDHGETGTTETTEECSSATEQGGSPTHDCVGGYSQSTQQQGLARLAKPPASRVADAILPPSLTRQATPRPQSKCLALNGRVPAWDNTSDTTDGMIPSPSTTPPPYRATVRSIATDRTINPRNPTSSHALSPTKFPKLESLQVACQTRERRGSVINEEDAWNKIKIARDEEDADKFRDWKLLERCWETWLLGYRWVIVRTSVLA